jgi:hypothetical protein
VKAKPKPSPEQLVADVDLAWRTKAAITDALKSWKRGLRVRLAVESALNAAKARMRS